MTRQDLIDAQLELGRHTDVVGELESLVEEHPFDERLRGQLMLARYRSGRQADALAAYQDARRALVDDLGLEPGAALRELEQAILRQDPSLDLPAVLPSLEERRKTVTVLSCEVVPVSFGPRPRRAAQADREGALHRPGSDRRQRRHGREPSAATSCSASSAFRPRTKTMRCGPCERRRSSGRELADVEVRIGIDTGEVLAGHGFVSGEVVSRGKRLQRESAAGDILLGEATLALCRNAVKVRSTRGAFRLLGIERERGRSPAGSTRRWSVANESWRRFVAHTKQACEARRPRLIAVVGEPGIGKTRLVRELVAGVGDEATVLVGRCVSYGQGATFLPLTRDGRPGRGEPGRDRLETPARSASSSSPFGASSNGARASARSCSSSTTSTGPSRRCSTSSSSWARTLKDRS